MPATCSASCVRCEGPSEVCNRGETAVRRENSSSSPSMMPWLHAVAHPFGCPLLLMDL